MKQQPFEDWDAAEVAREVAPFPKSLRERLGLAAQGIELRTCPTCGCHTAGPPPVACWACGVEPTPRKLAHVVILPGNVVWRALATMGGWSTSCTCGRTLHQWADKEPRPSHVQCPACRKWTVAP